jgi:hypothetical protein
MAEITRADVERLKKDWFSDPIWDIEQTEGFEQYQAELLAYRLECEAKWEAEQKTELEHFAAEIGIPGNLALAKHIRFLEERIEELEGKLESNEREAFNVALYIPRKSS